MGSSHAAVGKVGKWTTEELPYGEHGNDDMEGPRLSFELAFLVAFRPLGSLRGRHVACDGRCPVAPAGQCQWAAGRLPCGHG